MPWKGNQYVPRNKGEKLALDINRILVEEYWKAHEDFDEWKADRKPGELARDFECFARERYADAGIAIGELLEREYNLTVIPSDWT